jgi:hypothetical protein
MTSTGDADASETPRREPRPVAVDATSAMIERLRPDLSDLVVFRDPQTGSTWCGFGRPPNWIPGKDRAKYRVR